MVTTTKIAHFQGQISPTADKHPILPILICYSPWYFRWSEILMSFLPKIYRVVRQDLNYGSSWSTWQKWTIFKVKRAPQQINPSFCQFSCALVHEILVIRNSDVIFVKIFQIHRLNKRFSKSNEPWSRWTLILPNFVCYYSSIFWWFRITTWVLLKIFMDVVQLCYQNKKLIKILLFFVLSE